MLRFVETYFLLFLIYSTCGWLVETIGEVFKSGKLVNRGFLIGPYCPIYGYGVLLITLLLSKYKNDILLTFILAMLICGVLEYLTSYFMEKIFHARWWDYKRMRFNINGRICLETLVLFGLAGPILLRITNPLILSGISYIPDLALNIIVITLFVVFIIDNIVSLNVILTFKNVTREINDNTEEITQKVKAIISEKSILGKRLINAFPNLNAIRFKIKEKIEETIENGTEFIATQKAKIDNKLK